MVQNKTTLQHKTLSKNLFNYIQNNSYINSKLIKEFLGLNKEQHKELIDDLIELSEDHIVINSLQKIKKKMNFYYDARLLLVIIKLIISKKYEINKKIF